MTRISFEQRNIDITTQHQMQVFIPLPNHSRQRNTSSRQSWQCQTRRRYLIHHTLQFLPSRNIIYGHQHFHPVLSPYNRIHPQKSVVNIPTVLSRMSDIQSRHEVNISPRAIPTLPFPLKTLTITHDIHLGQGHSAHYHPLSPHDPPWTSYAGHYLAPQQPTITTCTPYRNRETYWRLKHRSSIVSSDTRPP